MYDKITLIYSMFILNAPNISIQFYSIGQLLSKQERISPELDCFQRHMTVGSDKLVQTLGSLHKMAWVCPQRFCHTIWAAESLSWCYLYKMNFFFENCYYKLLNITNES